MKEIILKKEVLSIGGIPALLIGEQSDKVYLFVHGKSGNKEEALAFADIVCHKGWQVLGIDLPEHGARKEWKTKLYPWTVIPELHTVMDYMKKNWNHISIRANSIGAWFSMQAFGVEEPIEKALFVSPMVDMVKLIYDMMQWADITEKELKEKEEVKTGFDETLSWRYLCFAKENPIEWKSPTCVLYAGRDNLVSLEVITKYANKYNANLTIMEDGEHWFHTSKQLEVLTDWENKNT